MNDRWLIDNLWIVPGDAQSSPLFQSLFASMPKNQPSLSDDKIGLFERWILALGYEGRNLARLEISDAPSYNFGSVTTGSTAEHAFTLENTGDITAIGLAAQGIAAPFRFKGGSFPGTAGTCLPVLAGKTSCTLVLEYAPSSAGTHTDTLEVGYHDGVSVHQITRVLNGTSAGISLASLTLSDSPTYNFGPVAVASTMDKSFTVTNVSSVAATSLSASGLAAPFSFKGGAYPGTGGNCAATLAAGGSCAIVVSYAPTANGSHASTLNVSYNTGAGTATLTSALSGQGAGGSGTPVYYSEIRGILTSSCLACHNSGADTWGNSYASLLAFKASTQSTAAIVPGNIATSRFVGRISGVVGGKPQMGVTPYGTLSAANRQKILDWIANGAPDDPAGTPADLVIDGGPTYAYGSVVSGSGVDHTFNVANTGGTVATDIAGAGLAAPFSFKGGAYPGTGGTCALSLAANGATCTIVVRFAPTSAANFSDSIELNYKSGTTAKLANRAVTGVGTGVPLASLLLSDSPAYDFGTVSVTAPVDKVFTVNNNGNRQATALGASGLAAPFAFKGGAYPGTGGTCATTLNMSASCTIVVRYTPTTNGTHASTLTVSYNNGSATRTLNSALSGIGAGAGAPVYYSAVRAILNTSCASCHDSAPNSWGTTYANLMAFKASGQATPAIIPSNLLTSRFARRISGVVGGQPQMGVSPYGSLSAANKQKILDWIAQGALNDPPGTPATLVINGGPTYMFGNVVSGSSVDHTFQVQNTGGTVASDMAGAGLAAPFRFKGSTYPGTGGTCATTLAANNATCTIVVTFSPTAAATFNDSIEINYKSGVTVKMSSRAVSGTGTGVPRATLTLNGGAPYNFGVKSTGSTSEFAFNVANTGSRGALTMSGAGLTGPFRFKGGTYPGTGGTCGAALADGVTCQVIVTFMPTANGVYNSTLTVNYNDGVAAQSVSVAVSGTGAGAGGAIYYSQIRAILTTSCGTCHSADWGTSYASLMAFRRGGSGAAIIAGNLDSRLAKRISGTELGPQMGSGANGSLSAGDRAKILSWIAQGAPNDPAGTVTQDFRPILGDRYYLASVLHKVYGPTVAGFANPIQTRADLFGSSCVHQDLGADRRKILPMVDSCLGANSDDSRLEAETNPASSTVGESIRVSACMRIADNVAYTTTALTGAGLTVTSPFTDANVEKIFERYYPGTDAGPAVLGDLREIGEQAVARAPVVASPGRTKMFEGWRYIHLALCMSPGWQAP